MVHDSASPLYYTAFKRLYLHCTLHFMEIQCLVHLSITNARLICQVIFITAVLIFLISVTIVKGYYLREIISGMN